MENKQNVLLTHILFPLFSVLVFLIFVNVLYFTYMYAGSTLETYLMDIGLQRYIVMYIFIAFF